jgi:AGCS family alanine or glycine:cation symporter
MTELMDLLDEILWGSVLIYLLLGTGIYLTLRSGFIQFRCFRHITTSLSTHSYNPHQGISVFQSLCLSMASRIGTGSLSGVAVGLLTGGPGAIFWMWVMTWLGMVTSMFENTLSQLFKSRDSQGRFRSSPAHYMSKGLGMRWMGIIFSVLLIISMGLIFNMLQANVVMQAITSTRDISPYYVSAALIILLAITMCCQLKTIVSIAQWVVPLTIISYLIFAMWLILNQWQRIPDVLELVIKSAFGIHPAVAGVMGYSVSQALTKGLQHDLFSNEAGLGSAPNAAGFAAPVPSHPAALGYSQMLGVFLDTLVICTATAGIVLSSGILDYAMPDTSGFSLLQQAIYVTLPVHGQLWLLLFIVLFAFSSIVANFLYAENSLYFLHIEQTGYRVIFRIVILVMLLVGCLSDFPTIIKLADIALGSMALINLTAILLLSNTALDVIKDYQRQRRIGKVPVFRPQDFPQITPLISTTIWAVSKKNQS